MDKSEMFGFSLESDDRTEEEKTRQKAANKSGLASALSLGQDSLKAPMDTDYEEDMEQSKPQIRFNLNFDKVEEVNWNKWNINLGKINEEPGYCDRARQPASDTSLNRPNRGRSWRVFFRELSQRRANNSTEMIPLSPTQV